MKRGFLKPVSRKVVDKTAKDLCKLAIDDKKRSASHPVELLPENDSPYEPQ